MASIDIFPISIGGVQPPLNLLSNIFSPITGSKNLSYPLDLASNPTFAHAVQFTIFDYEYQGLSGASSGFLEALQQTTGNVEGIISGGINGSTLEQGLNALLPTVKSALPFLQPQSYKPVATGAPKATISLYMPDTVNTTYDSNYQSVSMTDTLGLSGYIANALSDKKIKSLDWDNLATNLAGSAYGKQLAAVVAGMLGEKTGIVANGANLTGVLQQAFGQIPNPQMQLIYKGINLREFQFEFIFTPISAREAASVEKIIQTFVYYSLPQLSKATNGQFLIPPQIFKIKFAYTGGSVVLNAVTNVFNNTMTNILGTQLSGALNPTNAAAISNSTNTKLFSIQDCVLTNVNVDYAPNGWAAFSDGSPVQTRLTLQFKEMDIVTKDNIIPNNYSISPVASDAINSQIPTTSNLWEQSLQNTPTIGISNSNISNAGGSGLYNPFNNLGG